MKKTMPALVALALLSAPALHATDEVAGRPAVQPGMLLRNVTIPSAFRGLDGKTHPPGVYEMSVKQGTQEILIEVLKNGKRVAEVQGRYFSGLVSGFSSGEREARPAGGSTQRDDFQVHFDASSKVSFGGGGGAGKISCSNNLHPGGANLGSISFLLPAVKVQGK